jgi:hypothetical protein
MEPDAGGRPGDGGITVAEGIGDGAGGGSSNCSSSTGEVGRCSTLVHLGYGVASSKIRIPSSVVVKNTDGETLTLASMQSIVQFVSMLEYSLGDGLDARPVVILRLVSKLVP